MCCKNRPGENLDEKDECFGSGQFGQRLRYCLSKQSQRGNNGRTQSKTSAAPTSFLSQQLNSSSTGGGQLQNKFYAFQARQGHEDSPGIDNGTL